jgi:hypothetical protein
MFAGDNHVILGWGKLRGFPDLRYHIKKKRNNLHKMYTFPDVCIFITTFISPSGSNGGKICFRQYSFFLNFWIRGSPTSPIEVAPSALHGGTRPAPQICPCAPYPLSEIMKNLEIFTSCFFGLASSIHSDKPMQHCIKEITWLWDIITTKRRKTLLKYW